MHSGFQQKATRLCFSIRALALPHAAVAQTRRLFGRAHVRPLPSKRAEPNTNSGKPGTSALRDRNVRAGLQARCAFQTGGVKKSAPLCDRKGALTPGQLN